MKEIVLKLYEFDELSKDQCWGVMDVIYQIARYYARGVIRVSVRQMII